MPPGLTQVPQLELQHSQPSKHWVSPHWGPVGAQNCLVHPSPSAVQIPIQSSQKHRTKRVGLPFFLVSNEPQLALQHVVPLSQVVGPQVSSSTGTHLALPSMTWHSVSLVQRTVAQASVLSPGTGLASAVLAKSARARRW